MILRIEFKNGRWLVNDKRLEELNNDELLFMDAFFREVKMEQLASA